MEQTSPIKIISTIVIILLILVAGYFIFSKYTSPTQKDSAVSDSTDSVTNIVTVENTPMVNGALVMPEGFPNDIPFEGGQISESATTRYPVQGAEQLSISYRSSKTVAKKYAEYKDYMRLSGYTITEGNVNSSPRAIFGTKEDANLSVVISNAEGKTLVQLSYLVK